MFQEHVTWWNLLLAGNHIFSFQRFPNSFYFILKMISLYKARLPQNHRGLHAFASWELDLKAPATAANWIFNCHILYSLILAVFVPVIQTPPLGGKLESVLPSQVFCPPSFESAQRRQTVRVFLIILDMQSLAMSFEV